MASMGHHIPGVPEHENEPIPGLPERLPEGEAILWQGAPSWRPFAERVFRLRLLVLYFGALVAWSVADAAASGASLATVVAAPLQSVLLAILCLGVLALMGRVAARATLYTITNRRVVLRIGVALPMTINIPFALIESAAVKRHGDGTEDIVLTLLRPHRVSWLALWPHVRPFRMARPEPMLRAVAAEAGASQVLARALAASAEAPVAAMPDAAPRPQQDALSGAAVA
jgi:hypothetical protein